MTNEPYVSRTHKKFEQVLSLYEARIFRTVGTADQVCGMETLEHLRKPPAMEQMQPIQPGTTWGREYGNIWLRTTFTVPESLDGQFLGVIPDANAAEILCFRDGIPAGIITSQNTFLGSSHSAMLLTPTAKAGTTYDLAFECYAWHDCFGTQPYENYDRDENQPQDFTRQYRGIRFVVKDKAIRDFVFDASTALQLAALPGENFAGMKAHQCLMAAFPYLIQDVNQATDEQLHESAAKTSQILAPALKKGTGDRSRGKVALVGHSHMDTAWLWPVEETIRKCARTYSEVLTLMELYPEYTFIQSSALHLDWMRRYYPDIFEGIRQKVAEGRYEPNGGVWVECDCNVTGGESMVRQFLYGQRFTMKHLNYRSDTFWLPDTFGYNAAIPQIMQGSGIKYFCTTKLDWNDRNKFPAHTFVWRGLDGSEVIAHQNHSHFIPNVTNVTHIITELTDKRTCDLRLGSFGFGDGGGGPTYGMLEYARRVKDLDGMPVTEHTTVSRFMQEVETQKDQLPVYDGELYLELHRGTLTKMHQVKKNNRDAEIALHDLELFNVLSGKPVDAQRDDLYQILLKNQFHDIIPGTCIPKVYEIAIPEMYDLITRTRAATRGYAASMTADSPNTLSLYNTLSFDRSDVITLDGAYGFEGCDTQVYTDYDGNTRTAVKVAIPAMEAVSLHISQPTAGKSAFTANENTLTTPFYQVVFDENGYISALTDLQADRQIHRDGGAPLGILWFGEDMPSAWDNWDIDADIFMKLRPVTDLLSREVVSDGAVEYRVRSSYKLGKGSAITVDTVFYAASRRIDFDVKVDWHERHALLKAGFDVNVRSAFVKNEIQFGHIDRPTTRNTPEDAAKFEVCNHKWSDLSETHYGVALLNDCKYGISVEGSDMRLTLHKGGCRPDPATDNGVHTMTYSLLPHMGGFEAATVIHPAYELNYRPIPVAGILQAPKLFTLSNPGVLCEAVKNAEDVKSAYVLRLYEAERNAANCILTLRDASHVWVTNMLEEKQEELPIVNGQVKLKFRPFEIKTILVERS